MTLLQIDGLSKSFGGVTALCDVTFSVEQDAILGIMGANGAGKTTLFSLIAGNERPSRGTIRFDGRRIDGLSADRVSRSGIARTYQIVRPLKGLTVAENVATAALFGARPAASRREAAERASEILERLNLADLAGQPAGGITLSAQKTLEIAKALATGPRLLLLDEVMAGLTPTEVAAMLEIIRAIKADYGLTVLVIEHVMRALMQLSDWIVVLHHGEMIADGKPAAVAGNADVQNAYLGTAQ
jgi:branched-chain amino acid transport system ATP-binding protein